MSNRIFNSDVLEAIPKWVASGATSEDIAAVLGTTANSLRVMCSRNGVSLRPQGATTPPSVYAHMRRALSIEAWLELCLEAKRRGVPPVHLAFTILEHVSADNLFSAVMDDAGAPTESAVVQIRSNGR